MPSLPFSLSKLLIDVDKSWVGKSLENVYLIKPYGIGRIEVVTEDCFRTCWSDEIVRSPWNIAPNATPTPSYYEPIDRDMTTYRRFSNSSTSEVALYTLDFGQVVTAMVSCKFADGGTYSTTYPHYITLYASLDGQTWTTFWSSGAITSSMLYYLSGKARTFRYLRFSGRVSSTKYPQDVDIYEVVAFV